MPWKVADKAGGYFLFLQELLFELLVALEPRLVRAWAEQLEKLALKESSDLVGFPLACPTFGCETTFFFRKAAQTCYAPNIGCEIFVERSSVARSDVNLSDCLVPEQFPCERVLGSPDPIMRLLLALRDKDNACPLQECHRASAS
jgi:hypothetical protein